MCAISDRFCLIQCLTITSVLCPWDIYNFLDVHSGMSNQLTFTGLLNKQELFDAGNQPVGPVILISHMECQVISLKANSYFFLKKNHE